MGCCISASLPGFFIADKKQFNKAFIQSILFSMPITLVFCIFAFILEMFYTNGTPVFLIYPFTLAFFGFSKSFIIGIIGVICSIVVIILPPFVGCFGNRIFRKFIPKKINYLK